MKLSEEMKIATLAYWRFVRRHPLGAIECKNSDVLTVTRSFMVTDSEIKVSIADMQREVKTKHYKHLRMNGYIPSLYPKAHYFFFVVPEELQVKAEMVCDERYPNVGLLAYHHGDIDIYHPNNIALIRNSRRFRRAKVGDRELLEIAYGASNTAMRYINKVLAASE